MRELVAKLTYEASGSSRRVADLPHFVGHVVTDLLFREEFETAGVEDALVFDVVVVFDGNRFHRVHWIEIFGERH